MVGCKVGLGILDTNYLSFNYLGTVSKVDRKWQQKLTPKNGGTLYSLYCCINGSIVLVIALPTTTCLRRPVLEMTVSWLVFKKRRKLYLASKTYYPIVVLPSSSTATISERESCKSWPWNCLENKMVLSTPQFWENALVKKLSC